MIRDFDDFVARRKDPSFAQVSGYIDKEVAMRFKIACTALEVSQTDALEKAVKLWLEQEELKKSLSQAKAKGDVA